MTTTNIRLVLGILTCTVGLWAAGHARAADIERTVAIVCVTDQSRSITVLSDPGGPVTIDADQPDATRSRFGHWVLSGNPDSSSSEIRFLWRPGAAHGSRLNVHTTQTHHVLTEVRSEDRHSVVAVSSASDPLSIIGWLFSINFKLEQVLAASVRSNGGGLQSRAVQLACTFEDRTPSVSPPSSGSGIG